MADLGSLLGAAGVGGVIGKAIVSLELSTAQYQAELKGAEAQTASSTGAMGKSATGMSSIWKTAMFGVGAAVVAGVAVSIKAASDLNEQINKTKVVFEDNSSTVLAWSKTTAESMGVSERAALQAASSFGQILDAAGLAEDQTAAMSMQIVQLGSDLASFNNVDPNVALDKLQSGLAGMSRPLREFGIFISAARVENVAYRDGIAEVGAELTDAQKIQARYNIILEDSTKAQGDFQRTVGESLPNQMRVLKAELEDTAASLGNALLPSLLELAKVALDLVDQLGPLLDLIGKLAPAVHYLGEAFQFMTSPLIKVTGLIQQGIQPTEEMTKVIGDAALSLASMKAKAAIAADATAKLTDEAKDAGKAVHQTDIQFADLTLTLDENTDQTKITKKEFLDATNIMQREARQLADALKEIAKEDWVNPRYVAFLSEQGPEWLVAFADLTESQQHRAQQAWQQSTKDLDNARDSQDKMIGGLDKLDKSSTKHTVEIHYQYVGFDPSKPGMVGAAGGGTNPQQR